jgi:hypothetical protein
MIAMVCTSLGFLPNDQRYQLPDVGSLLETDLYVVASSNNLLMSVRVCSDYWKVKTYVYSHDRIHVQMCRRSYIMNIFLMPLMPCFFKFASMASLIYRSNIWPPLQTDKYPTRPTFRFKKAIISLHDCW